MPPRFFYFDLGNVLLNFDYQVACRQMAEVAGVAHERVWEIVFAGDLEWDYERGAISGRQFHELFCQRSGARPNYDQLHFAASAMFELNTPIVPIVAQLRGAGCRLGVLSNTCQSHWEYCSSGRYRIINCLFDVYALSYQIGAMKPEPKIYQAASELAGTAPQDIFFVDDRLENVAGAREAGFDAVLYTNHRELAAALRARGVRFNY